MKFVISKLPSDNYVSLVWDVFFVKKNRGVTFKKHFPFFYDNTDNIFVEAYENDRLVGGVAVSLTLCNNTNVSFAKLGLVCIAPAFQGKGYFKELFNRTLLELEAYSVDSIVLWSSQHELYSRFGFQVSDPYLFGQIVAPKRNDEAYEVKRVVEHQRAIPPFSSECHSHHYGQSVVYTSDFGDSTSILEWSGTNAEIEIIFRVLSRDGCMLNICSGDSLIELLKHNGYQLNLKKSRLQMQLDTKMLPELKIKVFSRI